MIKVVISGQEYKIQKGILGKDFLEMLPKSLQKRVIAFKKEEKIIDLHTPLTEDGELQPIFEKSAEALEILRHTTAHVMAQAVKRIFPAAKLAIGPAIENGFYYDFEVEKPFTPEDLNQIEAEMRKIINENLTLERYTLPREEAIEKLKQAEEKFKLELVEELPAGEEISFYKQGDFVDLCRGPHLISTGKIKKNAFKLLKSSGAYWRGDEKRESLQRIYGTAFFKEKDLKEYLNFLEEAKKRDHRKLGKELQLFTIEEAIGNGLILWLPKGARIRRLMEEFTIKEHYKHGYELVYTPHIAKIDLWHTSGHTGFYQENMFTPIKVDEVEYQLKPMNCPFHINIYKNQLRSYRDLPLRLFELGTVYRYERSGVLHGLMRVRGFTQDDAHIFTTPEQMQEEIQKVLNFTFYILRTFGFENYKVYLSTRPEKYVGTLERWELATKALKDALESEQMEYEIDPGEGVFYGPKIDIKIKDSLGRMWQCSTIQVDFNLPEKFKLSYIGSDGAQHQPIVIHRALMGSLERFFGILIEHYAGHFPLWLAPVQATILTVSDKFLPWAKEVYDKLRAEEIRVEKSFSPDKLNYKIRQAQLQKIPYMIIIGEKETENKTLTIRLNNGKNISGLTVDEFLEKFETLGKE
jgi:threonyl-tRNA synthetase